MALPISSRCSRLSAFFHTKLILFSSNNTAVLQSFGALIRLAKFPVVFTFKVINFERKLFFLFFSRFCFVWRNTLEHHLNSRSSSGQCTLRSGAVTIEIKKKVQFLISVEAKGLAIQVVFFHYSFQVEILRKKKSLTARKRSACRYSNSFPVKLVFFLSTFFVAFFSECRQPRHFHNIPFKWSTHSLK